MQERAYEKKFKGRVHLVMSKAMVKYRTAVNHYVGVNSEKEIEYVRRLLNLRGIESEVIDLTAMPPNEKALYPKPDFGFQTFKKNVLK